MKRRAGELLREMEEVGQRNQGGRRKTTTTLPTLKALGITRDQSSAWQQLAETPKALGVPVTELLG